jgi:hypothetical protein
MTMMNDDNLSIEQEIDAVIAKLTEGEHDEEGQRRVEALREAWRVARELIVDHEFRLLMLSETRRFLGDDDAEARARMPADERIARLAAKMTPNDAEDLLRAWHDVKTGQVVADLRELFASYRAERLQRLYELGGDCEA